MVISRCVPEVTVSVLRLCSRDNYLLPSLNKELYALQMIFGLHPKEGIHKAHQRIVYQSELYATDT